MAKEPSLLQRVVGDLLGMLFYLGNKALIPATLGFAAYILQVVGTEY